MINTFNLGFGLVYVLTYILHATDAGGWGALKPQLPAWMDSVSGEGICRIQEPFHRQHGSISIFIFCMEPMINRKFGENWNVEMMMHALLPPKNGFKETMGICKSFEAIESFSNDMMLKGKKKNQEARWGEVRRDDREEREQVCRSALKLVGKKSFV